MIIFKEGDIKDKINRPSEAHKILKKAINFSDKVDAGREHFLVIGKSTRHSVVYLEIVAIGNNRTCISDPTQIYRRAVENNVSAILIAHNHPSGEIEPSMEDIKSTKRIRAAGKILDISLHDHIIFTEDDFYSLREHGEFNNLLNEND